MVIPAYLVASGKCFNHQKAQALWFKNYNQFTMKKIKIQSIESGKKGEKPVHEVTVTNENSMFWFDGVAKAVYSKDKFKQVS